MGGGTLFSAARLTFLVLSGTVGAAIGIENREREKRRLRAYRYVYQKPSLLQSTDVEETIFKLHSVIPESVGGWQFPSLNDVFRWASRPILQYFDDQYLDSHLLPGYDKVVGVRHALLQKELYYILTERVPARLLAAIDESSSSPIQNGIVCQSCADATLSGFYVPSRRQIVLCSNGLVDQTTGAVDTSAQKRRITRQTLTHELVHAVDHCRPHEHLTERQFSACTEIRAYHIAQFPHDNDVAREQVRRYANLSMQSNFASRDEAKAVEEMFQRCYNDAHPFQKTDSALTRTM